MKDEAFLMPKSKKSFNSPIHLKNEQYKNSDNLSARMRVHELFSVAKEPWFAWVWRQIAFPENAKVLEIGAGTGLLWAMNLEHVPQDAEIVLSDLSEGMMEKAKETVGEDQRFSYLVSEADCLNYPDDSFDIIIANHMLYHVPDVATTLREMRRLLKPSGVFYAATNRESHMQELYDCLNAFSGEISAQKFRLNFVLENGADFLNEFFNEINCPDYPNGLKITDIEPLIDYIYSMQTIAIAGLTESMRPEVTAYFSELFSEKGFIEIRKHAGMFICR